MRARLAAVFPPGGDGQVTDAGTPESATGAAELADLASSIAQEAAELLLTRRDRVGAVHTKSSPTDVVTEMDRAAEGLIRNRLAAARPGDAVLGEEGGQTGAGSVRWIVDPLDGTVNYLYGLPDWAVSIAAEVAGEIVAGAVCVPLRRSLFTAVRGGGAWLESAWRSGRQRLACNSGVRLSAALVATGFSYAADQRAAQGRVAAAVLPRVRDIRRSGSAATDLCSVAAGQVDAYYERGVHLWDIAAGGLIAREAGARTGGVHGQPAGTDMTIAAADGLFAELHDLLAELRAAGEPAAN
jgi:myo-inositol-1(or 4)-monophosphatase